MDVDKFATADINELPPLPSRDDRRSNRAMRRLISVGNLLAAQSAHPQLREAWERALASLHDHP